MWQDSTGKCKQRKTTLFQLLVYYFGGRHIILQSSMADFIPRDPLLQKVNYPSSFHIISWVTTLLPYLLWFSNVPLVSSPNALLIFALRPLGGSFVTLTLFCRTVTGNDLVGMELRNNRKSSCTSASGADKVLIVVSMANIQDAARWQFCEADGSKWPHAHHSPY